MKYIRAINIETGAVAWEIQQVGPAERNYSGVLATAGDLVFYGETSGGFAAVDAKTGADAVALRSRQHMERLADDLHG